MARGLKPGLAGSAFFFLYEFLGLGHLVEKLTGGREIPFQLVEKLFDSRGRNDAAELVIYRLPGERFRARRAGNQPPRSP